MKGVRFEGKGVPFAVKSGIQKGKGSGVRAEHPRMKAPRGFPAFVIRVFCKKGELPSNLPDKQNQYISFFLLALFTSNTI